MDKPLRPVPPPLRGADLGSFAHHTVAVRLANTARQAIAENSFAPAVLAQLEALIADLPLGNIRPLPDSAAPDAALWQEYIQPYLVCNWLEAPWFFAETYFYRRILAATGYFVPGEGYEVDPFVYQKRRGLETTLPAIRALARRLEGWHAGADRPAALAELLALDLWGNQADMSLWAADAADQPRHEDAQAQQAHLLVNETTAVVTHLLTHSPACIDFVCDNAGLELVGDLAVADYLLGSQTAVGPIGLGIRLHLKRHPTFVSDALIKDVAETVAFLQGDAEAAVQALGARLAGYLATNRLILQDHFFWHSPLPFWQMPPDLRQTLGQAQLIISKGDANYRRLLGDSRWEYTTPLAEIVSYMPAPTLALRTLKAEVAAGLQPEQVASLNANHPHWLTNGRWGVIQFVP